MAHRIGVDAPPARVDVEHGRAELQNPRVSLIEVGDVDVQVELLWVSHVWPLRRPEVDDALEAEHETGFGVQVENPSSTAHRGSARLTSPPRSDR